ncbi:hypothetical protein MRB53_031146 [Persea americana]|uniref:Uncharacterized protein n=1 Tax=Persea americana TaxID=3435 RepID=A0ACC2KNC0_PERAE|nr:hypothetical protein MRB53_031146 [Persea americana]|eukprot:TRINITY_DN9853_c1_g1_i1.p1 TRINITY_DN9853_c1_g1~~TRINITY_DN9853_c1_g1_i1.p1  ORF type:complete len:350 (+),score=66.80 TRINITY_DN9853_c1_g1_i1:83-1132(+)
MEKREGSGLNDKTLMADFVENSAGDEDEKAAMEQYFMESPAASADFFDWSLDFSAANAKQSTPKEDEEPAPGPWPPPSSSQKKGAAGVSSSLPLRWSAKRRSLRIRRSPPAVVGPPLPPPPPPSPPPPPARASTRPKLTVRKSTGTVSSTTLRIAPAPAAYPPSSPSPRRTTRRKVTVRKPVSSPAVRIPAVAARKEALGPSPAPSALSPGRSSSASGSSSPGELLPEFYVNRKPWTKTEDEALRNYAAGNKKNWKKIASLLKKWERPYEDCIVRFYTVIRPAGGRGRSRGATTRGDEEEEEELNQENRVAKISADVCEIKKSIMELLAEMNVIGEKVDNILSTITNQK